MGIGDVPLVKPPDDTREYRCFVLPNLLKCLLVCDPSAQKATVCMSIHVGYFCDKKGLDGVAQLLQNYLVYSAESANSFAEYIVESNGSLHVSTLPERTAFSYDVDSAMIVPSLTRFANLFTKPKFCKSTIDALVGGTLQLGLNKEVNQSINQLNRYLSEDSAYHRFRPDNWVNVVAEAEKSGLNIVKELGNFFASYYCASRMSLVIHGQESLDSLQSIVRTNFNSIRNSQNEPVTAPNNPWDPDSLQIRVKASPANISQSLRLQWPITRNIQKQGHVDALTYLVHVFRLEDTDSLSSRLKNLEWISSYQAGETDCNSNFSVFFIHVELTQQGQGHCDELCGLVFNYIKRLKKFKPRKYIFNELEEISKEHFNKCLFETPMSDVDKISSNILTYPMEKWLIGSAVPSTYVVTEIQSIFNMLSLDKVRILWISDSFSGQGTLTEPIFATPYSVEKINDLTLKDWMKLSADEDPLKSNTAKTVRKISADAYSVPMRETRQRGRIVTTSGRSKQVPECIFVGAEVDSRVCIIYHEQMMNHRSSRFHYECPERIHAIMRGLQSDGVLQRCALYESERAGLKHLADVHTDEHIISILKETIAKKIKQNSDMYFSKGSENAIFMATGGSIKASFMVATGQHDYAFAVVRPPGHHARSGEESGFCYFNNVAVATKYLRRDHNMAKILIFDWDIHFGDGTSEIFYEDKNVLVVSMHRSDDFHTGFLVSELAGAENIGSGEGLGYNCNICWKEPKVTDDDFCAAVDYIVLPLATEFEPDMILISAGFDAAIGDPVGDCSVTKSGYATVLNKLLELNKGVVLILEGGYNLDVISECSSSCVKVLLGDKSEVKSTAEYFPLQSTWDAVLELRELLKPHWTNVFTSEIPDEVLARTRKLEDVVQLPKGA